MAKKAISFDLWQTLIFDNPALGAERTRLRLERMAAILRRDAELDRDALEQAYERSGELLVQAQAQEADLDAPDQVRVLLEGLPGDYGWAIQDGEVFARLLAAYIEPVLEVPPVVGQNSLALLEHLRSEGYQLALISNTGRTPGYMSRQLIRQLGLLDFFQVLVYSNELGRTKPHPAIFQQALVELGLEPEAVVHVGDDPVNDLWGAKRAGLGAVLLAEDGKALPPLKATPDALIRDLGDLKQVLEAWREE